jgi:hypothetical protein
MTCLYNRNLNAKQKGEKSVRLGWRQSSLAHNVNAILIPTSPMNLFLIQYGTGQLLMPGKIAMKTVNGILVFFLFTLSARAETGHELWLRGNAPNSVKVVSTHSATLAIAKKELEQGWRGKAGASVVLSVKSDSSIKGDGYRLTASGVQANTDLGILYGVYEMLRRQQTASA